MLAYKIVMCSMLGLNTVAQVVKTAQALRYKQMRLTIISAVGVVIAAAMFYWTLSL